MPEVPAQSGGLLGADFVIESSRYKIAKIYDGESWNPDLRAPLSAPGINVSAGDFILAIDGVDLAAPDNIYRLLDGTANRQTVLTVNSRADLQGARQVTVVPVASEQALRTRAWVEDNRRFVDKRLERPARVCLRAEHRAGRLSRASTATTSRSRTSTAR